MDTLFSTNDKWELLALHRVFIEAKFSEDPNDRDILASPIVCKMYERIFSELKKSEEKWDDWLNEFTERARTVVVSNIEKIQDWEW